MLCMHSGGACQVTGMGMSTGSATGMGVMCITDDTGMGVGMGWADSRAGVSSWA